MNVLQIVPELNAGGVERTVIEIAQALNAEGHIPHVASLGGRLEADLTAVGGVLHRFDVGSKNPLSFQHNRRTLIDIINHHNIDIVHARSRAPAWPARAAARATQTPFVTTYHGIYNATNPVKRYYNAVMTKSDVVIANSNFTKTHIIKTHGTDPNKITVIPRGVAIDPFDPAYISADDIAAQRAAWNIAPSQKIILLPGRLTRWKGQLVAIGALSYFPKALRDSCVLVLMGDAQGRTDYVSELTTRIKDLELDDQVRIAEHSDTMPLAIAASDCVVSASIEPEAFGRVAIEAQAMGKPVIATAHGGALETVINGETGLWVSPGDSRSMAQMIKKALNWSNYDGKAARARIQARFSTHALQSATLAIYRGLIK